MNHEINIKVGFPDSKSAIIYNDFIHGIFGNLSNFNYFTSYTYTAIDINYQFKSYCHIRIPFWMFQHVGVLFPKDSVLDYDDDPML